MARILACLSFALVSLALSSPAARAAAVGHHGGLILHCEPPTFFEESPPKEAKVAKVEKFSLTASEDIDPETVKAWVNAQPVEVRIERQRSGRYTVIGTLPTPVTEGRAWIKATGFNHDGCDQLHTWNVYAGQQP